MFAGLRRFADQFLLSPWWHTFDLDRVTDSLGEPDHLFDYMRRCFRYRSDRQMHGEEDYWQSPMHTWITRQGDCEDWALFAHHVFERRGMQSRIFCVFTPQEGHAVCVVRHRRFLWTLCNRGLRRLLAAGRLQRAGDTGLAEVAANAVYPMTWDSCAFVEELQIVETAADGTPWRYEPVLRWIVDGDARAPARRRQMNL